VGSSTSGFELPRFVSFPLLERRPSDVLTGELQELAGHYPLLRERLPNFRVAGGCCGTDDRHISAIAAAPRD
jgi:Homocysteine S-methyltransferase